MARMTRDGRSLKRILEWELNRDIIDADIAAALDDMPGATYSRRKDADAFPTFEELNQIGARFRINPRWLQVQFGYLEADEFRNPPAAHADHPGL